VGRMGPVLGRAGEGGGGGLTVRAGGNGRVGAARRRGDMSAPEMAAVWDVTVCGHVADAVEQIGALVQRAGPEPSGAGRAQGASKPRASYSAAQRIDRTIVA